MIGDVVGFRGGGEGKIEVGDDVAPRVWLGGVHVRVRFRDDPIGRNSRGDRDGAAEVLRRRNRCCGCFGRPLLRQNNRMNPLKISGQFLFFRNQFFVFSAVPIVFS